jgi:hypothetical protein
VLDSIRVPRPGGRGRSRTWPDHLIADKGYRYPRCRRLLRQRHIRHTIPERRPIFAQLLADAGGEFQVVVCYMNNRWARNIPVAYSSLSQLRRKRVWWATAGGMWDIDKVQQSGFDVAFAVDTQMNAAYSRDLSKRTIDGKEVVHVRAITTARCRLATYRPSTPRHPAARRPPGSRHACRCGLILTENSPPQAAGFRPVREGGLAMA